MKKVISINEQLLCLRTDFFHLSIEVCCNGINLIVVCHCLKCKELSYVVNLVQKIY
jgi:hypothetical protein